MALTLYEQAIVAAMELLRRQLQDNALGVAANTQATEDDVRRRAQAAADFVNSRAPGDFGRFDGQSVPGPQAVGFRGKTAGDTSGNPNVTAKAGPAPAPVIVTNTDPIPVVVTNPPPEKVLPDRPEFAGGGGRRAGPRGGPGASPVLAALGAVAQKFAAIAGPAAVLNQVLNSNVSGFGVLQQSVRVLAATIAPVLLPATLGLSAVFLSLSEVVNEHSGLTERLLTYGLALLPVLEFLVDILDSAADHVDELAEAANDAEKAILDFAAAAYRHAQRLNPTTTDEEDEEYIRTHFAPAGGGGEGPTAGEDKVGRGMRDALQSLRQSVGPRATSSGIADVGRQVQLSALNADPVEQRLMKLQLEALDRIEKKLPGRRTRPVYGTGRGELADDTGAGDYEGGSGSASGGGDY